jgi:hypothetical protein
VILLATELMRFVVQPNLPGLRKGPCQRPDDRLELNAWPNAGLYHLSDVMIIISQL